MTEELSARLVLYGGKVELHLVSGIGKIGTRVTANLHGWVGLSEPPLLFWPALLHVEDDLKFLKVFVRLTMQLEIGLEVCLVSAQIAVVSPVCYGDESLRISRFGTVKLNVVVHILHAVRAVLVANATLKHFAGVLAMAAIHPLVHCSLLCQIHRNVKSRRRVGSRGHQHGCLIIRKHAGGKMRAQNRESGLIVLLAECQQLVHLRHLV